jgi:outer membrane receptor protein involved in Fe transport
MAVQAIGSEELEAKNITDFADIAALSPSITMDSSGTGNSYFYIRGVSDGGFGNRAGAQASTAYYIDEQPVSTIGGNPDPHIYDINRVEILKGPQGTLYGSSSQSGTVRIITNKPDPSGFEAGFDIERGDIHDGSTDESLETFVNIPLGTSTALRISAYDISNGGWIDNVPSTVSFYYTGATIDNSSYVEDDYNWIDKSGHRIRLGHDMESGTTVDLSFLSHESFSNGSWETDVAEGARKNSRFADETFDDEFTQTSLTINGNLSDDVEFTFNTSIFDREIDYTYDYTNYVYTNYYDSYTAYAYDYDYYASTDARMFYVENDQYDRQSTEFRMQSTNDSGFRWILGVFIEDQELAYSTTYNMPAISTSLTLFQEDGGSKIMLGKIAKKLFLVRELGQLMIRQT